MRLSKEERWQLKLIRLATEVQRRNSDLVAAYSFNPRLSFNPHDFWVYQYSTTNWIVYNEGYECRKTAEEVYKWALDQCKRKNLI